MADRPLLALCLLGWACTTVYTNHAPLLPVLMASLGVGPAQAGLLSTATFVAIGLVFIPAGLASDRLGPRRVGSAGLAVTLLGTLGLGVARDFGDLLVLKALAGAGAGTAFIAGVRFASVAFPVARAYRVQGLYGGSVQLGGGTPLYLLPLLEGRLGWRGAFAAAAVPVAVALLAWLALAPDPRTGLAAPRLADAARSGRVWLLGLVHAATFGVSMIVGTWVTTFLVHDLGRSLVVAGAIGSAILVGGVVSRPLGGELVHRRALGPRALMRGALLVSALGVGCLAIPGRPPAVAAAAIVVLGLALSVPYAAVMNGASAVLPASPGAAVGIVSALALAVMAVAAPAVGAAFRETGSFSAPFAALALLGALVAWAAGRLHTEESRSRTCR
jgi:NNP family nitrate/nitrite transporter-like MFS transporter